MNATRPAVIMLFIIALSGWWLSRGGYAATPTPSHQSTVDSATVTPVTENELADVPYYAKAAFFGWDGPPESTLTGPRCN